jgi:hypothetical protein
VPLAEVHFPVRAVAAYLNAFLFTMRPFSAGSRAVQCSVCVLLATTLRRDPGLDLVEVTSLLIFCAKDELVACLENYVLDSKDIRTREMKLVMLNLAEFMEFMRKGQLPIPGDKLGDTSLSVRAYAKALYYKEREYRTLFGQTRARTENLHSENYIFFDNKVKPRDFFCFETEFLNVGVDFYCYFDRWTKWTTLRQRRLRGRLRFRHRRRHLPAASRAWCQWRPLIRLTRALFAGRALSRPLATSLRSTMPCLTMLYLNRSTAHFLYCSSYLRQSAIGLFEVTRTMHELRSEFTRVEPSLNENLSKWEDALDGYACGFFFFFKSCKFKQTIFRRYESLDPISLTPAREHEVLLGRIRCLDKLGMWEQLHSLIDTHWVHFPPAVRAGSDLVYT